MYVVTSYRGEHKTHILPTEENLCLVINWSRLYLAVDDSA